MPPRSKLQEPNYSSCYTAAFEDKNKWEQVRINASISVLNSLLETTKHSVIEEVAVKDAYARVAVAYADSLIRELRKEPDWLDKLLEL